MTTKSTNDNMEKIRKARSLNDVVSIVESIAKDVHSHRKSMARAHVSLSAKSIKEETITIDHTGEGPTKIKAGPKSKSTPVSGGVKIEFHAPKVSNVADNTAVVHELHDNLHQLEAAEAMIKQAFSRAKNQEKALKGIAALKKECELSLQRAYEVLGTIARKHAPAELEQLNQDLFDYVLENVNKTKYEDIAQEIYVTVRGDGETSAAGSKKSPVKLKNSTDFSFSCYTIIEKLQNSDGYIFPEYVMVLTGLIDRSGTLRFFLNALPDFKEPGKYELGAEVTSSEDMLKRAALLLAHNDIVTQFERKPMPLTTKDAKDKGFHNIKNVDRAYVADDELYVLLKSGKGSDKTVVQVQSDVLALLNSVLGINSRKRSVILPAKPFKVKGQTALKFSLIPNIPESAEQKEYTVNVSKLRDLQHVLGLPDHVIDEVKKAMKHRV